MRRTLARLAVLGILCVSGVSGVSGVGGVGVARAGTVRPRAGASQSAHGPRISAAGRGGGPRDGSAIARPRAHLASRDARPVVRAAEPLRVLLVGDSLAWEAQGPFTLVLMASQRAQVQSMVYGGTALCDWLTRLEAAMQTFQPQVVVMEFSGNNLTPCMQDPATGTGYAGEAYLTKYRTDANAAMELFTRYGVRVYWADAPISRGEARVGPIPSVYAQLSSRWPNARYVDAGASVLDHGTYTDYLPCLRVDPCTDRNPATGRPGATVRAPDGHHFCPGAQAARRGVTDQCPVWSSGAWRYGTAMAAPVIVDYRL